MNTVSSLVPVVALTFASAAWALPSAPQGAAASPGFRLFGPHNTNDTFLVDTAGVIVHSWPGSYFPGNGMYLIEDDGRLVRTGREPGGPTPGGFGGNVQRRTFDGTLEWEYTMADADIWHHHDIALMPNGNILAIVWDRQVQADAIAAGRNPATVTGADWLPDAIIEIEPVGTTDGNIVWEWHVSDHLIQDFDATKANFGVVSDHPELLDINYPPTDVTNGDWNHANSISYDPARDLILINFPFQDELFILDHSTTTAEAAGHTGGNYGMGGDFLYRWGNPQAYGQGDSSDQVFFNQHGAYVIPEGLPGAGNILIFNNQAGFAIGEEWSSVIEIAPPYEPGGFTKTAGVPFGPTTPVWEYCAPTKTDLYSSGLSNVERLPNGNTQIMSGRQGGWMFEVTPGGAIVWEYFPVLPDPPNLLFQVSYYERTLWATGNSLSVSAGGTIDFDLVSGSVNAGNLYLVLGSLAGTSPGIDYQGFNLPLNLDSYFLFTAANANGAVLPGTFGTLDGLGNGAAQLVLGAGVAAATAGMTAHHAYAVLDPVTLAVQHTSNAAATELLP
ncbi:MAG: aryl-sulfate sulfotransferase [Planctomycetota bacterium]